MKPMAETEIVMDTPIRKKTRDDQVKPENLVPVNTALPPEILEMAQKEADLEYINLSQVLRRIVVQHYRPTPPKRPRKG